MFISFLYMFRVTVCPSREITVSMRHLVFVTYIQLYLLMMGT